MVGNLILTIFFVFLNAFFVAAEFAIVKVRSSTIEISARSGNKIAGISKNIINHLDTYLSATQLGITIASLGLGWIGESVVSTLIIDIMNIFGINLPVEIAHKISLPTAFVTITFLHIVFGELTPKNLAIQYPEKVTLFVSIPLKIFFYVFRPVIWALNSLANVIIKFLGLEIVSESHSSAHTPEEFLLILQESSDKGVIALQEHELIENVFEFADTPVKQVMVPRNKIVAIDIHSPIDIVLNKFLEEGYSRMPVFDESIDNIVGEIYAKDIIRIFKENQVSNLDKFLREPFFVQENEKINITLKKMQLNKIHQAIVLDEFGGTAGIVSLEDIIEELVGEIQDEYDEEVPLFEKIDDNTFIVLATIPINDLNDNLPEPFPESDDYETIGGFIMTELGRIPELGEKFKINNYKFEIISRTTRKIEKIKLCYDQNFDNSITKNDE
jgi:CBS domain containing-hemolysin-like protein